MKSGLSKAQAAKRIYMFDKDGLVTMVSINFCLLIFFELLRITNFKSNKTSKNNIITFINMQLYFLNWILQTLSFNLKKETIV